jgi:hypothetical protein
MSMDEPATQTARGTPPVRAVDAGRFAPGTVLADRYRIVSLLGRGGMGEVYRADDQRVGQTVALKFLPVQLEDDLVARNRMFSEVRNARAISHPNVCRVYDVGDLDGRHFLTMEYIDGEDLASLLRRIERLPPSKALAIARQLCSGLAAAHDRGVLHRDLKPANIMIDGRGVARIADFGLAVESGPGTAADGGGTLAYMAPEIFEHKPATAQSDLYSLGLILYEAYTGKRPFRAATVAEWQRAHSDSAPTHPSAIVAEIEPAVERIILRCLEKDPAKRPLSASQVAAALPGGDPLAAALAAGETPSPALVAASGEEGTLPRARAWLWLSGCLVSLLLAIPLAGLLHLPNLVPSRDPLLQVAEVRSILGGLGLAEAPADSRWWYRSDEDSMRRLAQQTPPSARFTPSRSPVQGALIFCYRQSSRPMFAFSPLGGQEGFDPPPLRLDDVYLELNPEGGLRTLVIGGLQFGTTRPPRAAVSWPQLFAAAGLDPAAFTEVVPRFAPMYAFDSQAAWEGNVGGELIRVEASSYQGWPTEFRLLPASRQPIALTPYRRVTYERALDTVIAVLMLAIFTGLGVLARHNLRAGRGDRTGAMRIGGVIFVAQVAILALNRHWTIYLMQSAVAVFYFFGLAFILAMFGWLFYLGIEPPVRRRWPHLLIAWTRLLDGGWRDALVGRATLSGIVYALWMVAIIPGLLAAATRWLDLPLSVPVGQAQLAPFTASIAALFADRITLFAGAFAGCYALAALLLVRLLVRNTSVAWVVLFLALLMMTAWTAVLFQRYAFVAPVAPLLLMILVSLGICLTLGRHGLLGAVVFSFVGTALVNTPVTADFSRWYAWRTMVLAAMLIGLSIWGFRNVLGAQRALPSLGED